MTTARMASITISTVRHDCADPDCSGNEAAGCTESPEAGHCTDGIDNDADGLIDCADSGCWSLASCREDTHARCHDGIDNDLDGVMDCHDSDCAYDPPSGRTVATCTERDGLWCNDGIDNDQDGAADCLDSQCSCFERCDDGQDNNGNGWHDCEDLQYCQNDPACAEDCLDDVDNNFDGQTDCRDIRCNDHAACEEICDDTFDNNRDGRADCADPRCDAAPHCEELSCSDGLDNELDGHIDCADLDCRNRPVADDGCNSVDEDCDGRFDEDFVGPEVTCGVGACLQESRLVCIAGVLENRCLPRLASPEVCDGVDNDCDGSADEPFPRCENGAVVACHAGVPQVTVCNDGNVCNGLEACETGACLPGTPLALDDGDGCTFDSCDPVLGVSHEPMNQGDACDDGDYCTEATTCDESLTCGGGTLVGAIDDGNPCTADICDPEVGAIGVPLADGSSCADQDVCNGEELCMQGLCTAGQPLALDDDNDCTIDSCDMELGALHTARSVGAACEDGDPCTTGTTCDASVMCTGGGPLDVDDQDACTIDSCDPERGPVHESLPTGTSCSNDDVCDGLELCMAAYERFLAIDPRIALTLFSPWSGAFSLEELGIAPGQRIELRGRGEFAGSQLRREPFGTAIHAVFARQTEPPPQERYDQVACDLPSYVTQTGAFTEDFAVPAVGVVVTVPATATHLLLAADDDVPNNNSDADQDFGVELRTVIDGYQGAAVRQVDPASTFLERTDDDGVVAPMLVALDELGVAPGDQLDLRATGAWTRGHGGSLPIRPALLGAFSSSSVVLPRFAPSRIAGAIASDEPPFETTADIAEDFLIPQSGVLVTVPAGASWLIVGADHDVQWPSTTPITQRVDDDNDFGLVVQKHQPPIAGCMPGTPMQVDDGEACTIDVCHPVTGPSHTPSGATPTCSGLGAECGSADAGCGVVLDCGACAAPEVCGEQEPNTCGAPSTTAAASIRIGREVNVAARENGAVIVAPPFPEAVRLNDVASTIAWYSFGAARGPQVIEVELDGQLAPVIDRISIEANGGAHTLEAWAAESLSAPFVALAQRSAGAGFQAHALSFVPTRARVVRLVLQPATTGTWTASARKLRILTRAREGGVVSLAEAGAQVIAASATTSSPADLSYDAIDFSGSAWRVPTTGGGFLTMRLSPQPVWVDQLEILGNAGISGLPGVALDLSSRRDGTELQNVVEAYAPVSTNTHVINFEPMLASSAQLRVSATNSGASNSLQYARLYSQRLGGAVVPFIDATAIARDELASWAWNFGDGHTSSEQHPLHTYDEPGTYEVTLTVTDVQGAQSTARLSYTVVEPPVADFIWEPIVVEEGGGGFSSSSNFNVGPLYELYDRSVPADGQLVLQRAWSSTHPSADFEVPSVTEATSKTVRFLNDGPHDVTLSALDSQLVTGTVTKRIEVLNVPPTVDAGTAVAGIWGMSTRIGLETTVKDQGRDDHWSLRCVWDFGDGHAVEIADCARAARTVTHTYEDPGTYAVSLTAFDDDTSTTDFVQVVQNRRFTSVVPEPLEATAEDGVFIASARLLDALSYEPLAGYPLRIRTGDQDHVVTTDASGYASVSLRFAQLSFVTVEYAFEGDARYEPATTPIDFLVREGDTEPQPTLPPTAGQEATRFVIGFPQNYYNVPYTSDSNFVGVTITSQVETNALVSAPGIGFFQSVHVLPGQSQQVALPVDARMGIDIPRFNIGDSARIEDKGIEIESEHPVSVYGFDFIRFSTDGFSAIPLDQLGTEYFALAYSNEKNRFYKPGGTQIGIVATEDDTEITITPTEDVAPGPELPSGSPKGVPFTVVLDRLQTFQIVAHAGVAERFEDLTGTHIASTKPIAVLGGHVCIAAGGNAACNHIVEQLPPTKSWGTRFITAGMPALPGHVGRPKGEYLRVLAASDGTEVRVDGELVATLARGEHAHLPSGIFEGHEIVTSAPALVAQYIKAFTEGYGFSHGARQDPFMAIVPAVDQYSARYELAVAVPNVHEYIADRYQDGMPPAAAGTTLSLEEGEETEYWADNKISIIAPTAEVGGIRIDGEPVAAAWFVIGQGEYAVARIPVDTGLHRLSHEKPGVRFGAFAYGFNYYDAYGYPAGLQLGGRRACEVSAPRPLDGVDNDCDGIRDEEILNGLDDDGDGVEDEDLNEVTVPNRAPVAYSTYWQYFNAADYLGRREVTERFALPAFDADGDQLTWSLLSNSLGSTTASISGNILSFRGNLGTKSATLRIVASDGIASSAPALLTIGELRGSTPPAGVDQDSYWIASRDTTRLDCETSRPEGISKLCNSEPYMFGGTVLNLQTARIPIPSGEVVQYTARVHAHDLDKDEVRYHLVDGPDGMEVEPTTGIVRWTVDSSDVGRHPVRIGCSDYRRGQGPLSQGSERLYTLSVEATDNALPVINSTPGSVADPGETYSYQVVASDPEGDALTYQLLAGPAGMHMSPTGLVTWTPRSGDVGTHSAAIRVTDAQNAGQSQRWTIAVAGSPLRIVSAPPLQAAVDTEYTYLPEVVDDSGGEGPYAWSLGDSALGMSIASGTGRVSWTPADNQLGRHNISIEVNSAGAVARQFFSINVEAIARAPEVTSEPLLTVIVGGLYVYDVNATDYGHLDVLEYELVSGPPGMVIDPLSGVIQWIPEALATEMVTVRVTGVAPI